MDGTVDVLMITYNRPNYTKLALTRLLETSDERMRVWLWQNGSDPATLEVVRSLAEHPRVHRFHHSEENQRLTTPTNWLFEGAQGDFVSKVDDDCLMPFGWAETLRQAYADEPRFGVLGCWRFPDEDFQSEVASRKIKAFSGGHRVMQNCWVEGSGYLMRRQCVTENGLLKEGTSFSRYCIELARRGWTNGWYYPFLYQEHMDDPCSGHCELKRDEDLLRSPPLMAQRWGVRSISEWRNCFREEALYLQSASPDPRTYVGWRRKLGTVRKRLESALSGRPAFKAAG
ncbi:MAG: glycosyltransferase family A protein [Planctomycetaceae bacterium]